MKGFKDNLETDELNLKHSLQRKNKSCSEVVAKIIIERMLSVCRYTSEYSMVVLLDKVVHVRVFTYTLYTYIHIL